MADDWENFGEIAQHRDELDPEFLRGLLAKALRRRGYGVIVVEDADEGGASTNRMPDLFAVAFIWGFVASAALALGGRWYHWLMAIVVIVGLLAFVTEFLSNSTLLGALLIVTWLTLGVLPLVAGDLWTFLIAYGVPLIGILLYGLSTRALRLRDAQDIALALGGVVRSAPLVAPVVLIVLFLPALNNDVWEVADTISASALLLLGAVTVGVLLIVVRLQLGSEVGRVIESRSGALCDSPERLELTRRGVEQSTENEDAKILEGIGDSQIEDSWPPGGEEYAPYLSAVGGSFLQKPLTARLLLTVGVVAFLLAAYIYILISAGIPGSLASKWSQSSIASVDVHLLGVTVTLHGGPYLKLAGLLGLAATATFLSFALVEERFASALTGALLHEPTDQFLVLSLPYLALRERVIEGALAGGGAESEVGSAGGG